MAAIQFLFNSIIMLYIMMIFAVVIMSWLINFGVMDRRNQMVDSIWRGCVGFTEPALRPIRNMLPNMGGLDISPIILLFGLQALQIFGNRYIFEPMVSRGL